MSRNRKWVLCINPESNCYSTFFDTLDRLTRCKYAYIVHTLDTDENGKLKLRHFHLCLEFENARTFDSIKKAFPGAHIETPICWTKAVQYLVHKNDPNKYQYIWDCVISNSKEYYTTIYNNEIQAVTRFDFNKMRDYIVEYEKTLSRVDFAYFLTTQFPLDTYKIIRQQKQINEYVELICENDPELCRDIDTKLKESLF